MMTTLEPFCTLIRQAAEYTKQTKCILRFLITRLRANRSTRTWHPWRRAEVTILPAQRTAYLQTETRLPEASASLPVVQLTLRSSWKRQESPTQLFMQERTRTWAIS